MAQARLVAFTGPAGCGKSTAAGALVEHGWARVKFAYPLKNMLRAFYHSCGVEDVEFIEARIEGDQKEEPCGFLRGRTPRHAMQTLGTEWGRSAIASDLWVSAWRYRASSFLEHGIDVVVDDCRFPNEAEAVRELGGTVCRILSARSGEDGPPAAVLRETEKRHASEMSVIEADMRIANASSLEGFKRDVVHIFHRTNAD